MAEPQTPDGQLPPHPIYGSPPEHPQYIDVIHSGLIIPADDTNTFIVTEVDADTDTVRGVRFPNDAPTATNPVELLYSALAHKFNVEQTAADKPTPPQSSEERNNLARRLLGVDTLPASVVTMLDNNPTLPVAALITRARLDIAVGRGITLEGTTYWVTDMYRDDDRNEVMATMINGGVAVVREMTIEQAKRKKMLRDSGTALPKRKRGEARSISEVGRRHDRLNLPPGRQT